MTKSKYEALARVVAGIAEDEFPGRVVTTYKTAGGVKVATEFRLVFSREIRATDVAAQRSARDVARLIRDSMREMRGEIRRMEDGIAILWRDPSKYRPRGQKT